MTTGDRNHVTTCAGLSAGLALPSHWQLLLSFCSLLKLPGSHCVTTETVAMGTHYTGRELKDLALGQETCAQPTCLPVATAEGLAFPTPPCWLPRLVLLEPGARWTGHQHTPGREVTCPTAQALPGSLGQGQL